jgi:hypothetical protein
MSGEAPSPEGAAAAAPEFSVCSSDDESIERNVVKSSAGPVPFPGIRHLPPREPPEPGQVLLRYDVEEVRRGPAGRGCWVSPRAGQPQRAAAPRQRSGCRGCMRRASGRAPLAAATPCMRARRRRTRAISPLAPLAPPHQTPRQGHCWELTPTGWCCFWSLLCTVPVCCCLPCLAPGSLCHPRFQRPVYGYPLQCEIVAVAAKDAGGEAGGTGGTGAEAGAGEPGAGGGGGAEAGDGDAAAAAAAPLDAAAAAAAAQQQQERDSDRSARYAAAPGAGLPAAAARAAGGAGPPLPALKVAGATLQSPAPSPRPQSIFVPPSAVPLTGFLPSPGYPRYKLEASVSAGGSAPDSSAGTPRGAFSTGGGAAPLPPLPALAVPPAEPVTQPQDAQQPATPTSPFAAGYLQHGGAQPGPTPVRFVGTLTVHCQGEASSGHGGGASGSSTPRQQEQQQRDPRQWLLPFTAQPQQGSSSRSPATARGHGHRRTHSRRQKQQQEQQHGVALDGTWGSRQNSSHFAAEGGP